ncbi:hypothetical protein [Nonomuraea dietziae]|uniref:hypothetical protein n=1 Tax=Nonomuraea dietziae TaxID=65515 RepID=UPI0031DE25C0
MDLRPGGRLAHRPAAHQRLSASDVPARAPAVCAPTGSGRGLLSLRQPRDDARLTDHRQDRRPLRRDRAERPPPCPRAGQGWRPRAGGARRARVEVDGRTPSRCVSGVVVNATGVWSTPSTPTPTPLTGRRVPPRQGCAHRGAVDPV